MKLTGLYTFLAIAFLRLATCGAQCGGTEVDLELALLVDVSGSVSTSEFELQRDGLANAFKSQDIKDAIQAGTNQAIAATLVYWAGASSQLQAIAWTRIGSDAESEAFGNAIGATARPFSGSTAIGSAINFAIPLFGANDCTSPSQVIDISGDGQNSDGASLAAARDAAFNAGITINFIAILPGVTAAYAEANVITPPGESFALEVSGFEGFEDGIKQKLELEITPGCFTCDGNNPCTEENIFDSERFRGGQFYFPHCEPTMFVQCDAHGGCFDRPCAPGTEWNDKAYTCTHLPPP